MPAYRSLFRPLAAALTVAVLFTSTPAAAAGKPAAAPAPAAAAGLQVPVEYYRLPNGLRVVLSRDTTLPTTTVGVYYQIGFRIEPKGRTGFAHLFEHMMFQGTPNLPKGGLDQIDPIDSHARPEAQCRDPTVLKEVRQPCPIRNRPKHDRIEQIGRAHV